MNLTEDEARRLGVRCTVNLDFNYLEDMHEALLKVAVLFAQDPGTPAARALFVEVVDSVLDYDTENTVSGDGVVLASDRALLVEALAKLKDGA